MLYNNIIVILRGFKLNKINHNNTDFVSLSIPIQSAVPWYPS